jgi:hypothetical protein
MAKDSGKWIKTREEKPGWSKSHSSKQNQVVNLHSGPMLHCVKGTTDYDDDDDDDDDDDVLYSNLFTI